MTSFPLQPFLERYIPWVSTPEAQNLVRRLSCYLSGLPLRFLLILALVWGAGGSITLWQEQHLAKKEREIAARYAHKVTIADLLARHNRNEKEVKRLRAHYQKVFQKELRLKTIEMMYQTMSNLAVGFHLDISQIQDVSSSKSDRSQPKKVPHDVMKEFSVMIVLKGRYHDYMQFREALLRQIPLLHVQEEGINSVVQNEKLGTLQIQLTLKGYLMDMAPYRAVLFSES